jgi:hypothetical protein
MNVHSGLLLFFLDFYIISRCESIDIYHGAMSENLVVD